MAKIKFGGGTLLSPLPVTMVTCGTAEKPNIITVAWCGITATQPPTAYISIRPKRYSYRLIRESGEFAINLTGRSMIRAADSCGVYTGAKVDKFKRFGLTPEPANEIGCPLIAESPMSLECKVKQIVPLGSHDMFIADIVAVDIDEKLIDKNGKFRLDNAELAAFAHGEYFALGQKLGSFGYSVRKKKK